MSGLAAWVTVRVEGGSAQDRERALLAAVEAGASGAEEQPDALVVHVPGDHAAAVDRAIRGAAPELRVGAPLVTPDQEWSEAWKEGLEPMLVGERLAIQPSFRPLDEPGERLVLTIEPGQAFGTGGHASTRLALELLEAGDPLGADVRVLDVGCGTGILALAALGLGGGRALAIDLDPLATEATIANARLNGLADRVTVFCGPLGRAPGGACDLALANMIRSELLPVLPEIARRCEAGARLIVSGLLASEATRAEQALASLGFAVRARAASRDDLGDHWLALEATMV